MGMATPRYLSTGTQHGNTAHPVRAINDPLGGPLLLVGGACPTVHRVVGARGLLTYRFLEVAGTEWTANDKTDWPEIIPRDMLWFRYVAVVPLNNLRPVDIVAVTYGQFADAGKAYYLWQAVERKLHPMNDTEVRGALVSPWLVWMRDGNERIRGINLAQLEE